MLQRIFRAIMTLVGALIGYGLFLLIKYVLRTCAIYDMNHLNRPLQVLIPAIFVIIFGLLLFALAPAFGRNSQRAAKIIERDLQNISSNSLVAGAIGLVIGLVLARLISSIYGLINLPFLPLFLTIVTYLLLGYLGVVVAGRKGKEFLSNLMSMRRSLEREGRGRTKGRDQSPKILDTSVIIDGRIADIMETGFLEGDVIIPEFVLLELQHIADSSDSLKRNRGRRGLDILKRIQTEHGIEIYDTVKEKGLEEIPEVDIKLLKLAQNMGGKVVTNDFNLNKVAGIKDVEVLNINELANTLKPVVLPGEPMELFLVKEGKEKEQAVAYLDDGTMIVVDDGRKHIGKTVTATVSSVLQTAAGRMIFAQYEPEPRKKK